MIRCAWQSVSARNRSRFPGSARRIADDIVSFAHTNNVTQIVVGKTTRSRWFELLNGSVVHDLVRRAGDISVQVIGNVDDDADPQKIGADR